MSDDLVAFLRARLDEDEAVAKDEGEHVWFGPYPETLAEREGWLVIQQERALREVEARRIIHALHLPTPHHKCLECGGARWPCMTSRALAAPYSDHPDYRAEWKLQ